MGPWRWRPAIVRVAETEGAVGPAFLIASEIARQAEAPGTPAAPGIAIRRLGRRGHRIHCQCQDGENDTNDSRWAHGTPPETASREPYSQGQWGTRKRVFGRLPDVALFVASPDHLASVMPEPEAQQSIECSGRPFTNSSVAGWPLSVAL
jgi:hypothetical protein